MYFSFLARFPITSLVVFAELSILLCYEVLIYRVSIFVVQFLSAILSVPAQFCRSCQSFLISLFSVPFNFTVLHSISLFCTGEIALFTDLGLIEMFSANQNAEIAACILLKTKLMTVASHADVLTVVAFSSLLVGKNA